MKKIVAVGHHRKYCKAADDQTASTDQFEKDLECGMKCADLDFSKYTIIVAYSGIYSNIFILYYACSFICCN